jgi:hypothetical protein
LYVSQYHIPYTDGGREKPAKRISRNKSTPKGDAKTAFFFFFGVVVFHTTTPFLTRKSGRVLLVNVAPRHEQYKPATLALPQANIFPK